MKTSLLAAAAALIALTAGAEAADLVRPRQPVAATVVAQAAPFNWTGFYLGGHLGYGWGRTGWTYVAETVASNPKGIFGGLQGGYNWQVNNFVIGVEQDLSAAAFSDRDICGANATWTCTSRTNWLGSTRLRGGLAADRALFYVTGGLGYGDTRVTTVTAGGPISSSRFRVGYAVGAGVEYAFAQNWTAKAEYLYFDLGRASYAGFDGDPVRARFQYHTMKVGLSYLFSTGPAPVSARY